MKSVMKHNFSQVPRADIPRSSFNRSHGHKTTFNGGQLIPVFLDEVLPGDSFNCRMTAFARLATPLHPFMDNLFMDTFFFFIPNRLVHNNWQRLNGEQDNPGDSTDFIMPNITIPVGGWVNGSLADHFGLPTEEDIKEHISTPFRAYNLVWNEWFRDENLQDSVTVDKGDGPDDPADYVLLPRGKRHDYFTSCLPSPQKGPAVPLPLGSTAPVIGIGKGNQSWNNGTQSVYETGQSGSINYTDFQFIQAGASTDFFVKEDDDNAGFPGIFADLTQATGATVNALRESFQIQKMYEKDARGGTRYTEVIRAHFGVTSPDARLQRPEYLGGGSQPISISTIAQTSETGTTPQGTLAAMGTVTINSDGFTKSFTEHGIVIGLVAVRADLNYQQGLNKMWSRSTRFDFYWPSFQGLGEQAVLNKEIFADGSANDELVFGYQERYGEYRYKQSQITGQFRSNFAQTLDTWHLAQDFLALPTLSSTFIEDNPPIARVIAVPSYPHFLFDSYFNYQCARPMPTYSVPGLIDHF